MTRAGSARLKISDHLRLILRIWLRIRSEGVHRVERAENLSKCWDYLVDHSKQLQAEGDNRDILQSEFNELGTILSKADMPSLEIFINIYSKILVNSFSLRSDRWVKAKVHFPEMHSLVPLMCSNFVQFITDIAKSFL